MTDKIGAGALEKGEYVIGVAVILAALLISLTMYVGLGGIEKAVGAIKLTTSSGTGTQAGSGTGSGSSNSTGTTGTSGGASGTTTADWSFVKTAPGVGPADAKVTVVVFSDIQCPICAIAEGNALGGANYDIIRGTSTKAKDYAVANGVRFVYKTMAFLGQESIYGANALYCVKEAGGEEAYLKLHEKLVAVHTGQENAGLYSKENLKKYAAAVGYNTTAVASCIDSDKYLSQVVKDTTEADAVGVTGTPTFAVNNVIVKNGAVYTTLKAAIDEALSKKS